jgi:hypothetical protein
MPRPRKTQSQQKKNSPLPIELHSFFLQDRTQNHTQTPKKKTKKQKKNTKIFKKTSLQENGIKEQKTRRKNSIKTATRQKADAAEKHTSK